jgi:uncharacterized membrane protein YeaQ/YmgE (transglycosylase-associated protein family)
VVVGALMAGALAGAIAGALANMLLLGAIVGAIMGAVVGAIVSAIVMVHWPAHGVLYSRVVRHILCEHEWCLCPRETFSAIVASDTMTSARAIVPSYSRVDRACTLVMCFVSVGGWHVGDCGVRVLHRLGFWIWPLGWPTR